MRPGSASWRSGTSRAEPRSSTWSRSATEGGVQGRPGGGIGIQELEVTDPGQLDEVGPRVRCNEAAAQLDRDGVVLDAVHQAYSSTRSGAEQGQRIGLGDRDAVQEPRDRI